MVGFEQALAGEDDVGANEAVDWRIKSTTKKEHVG